MVADSCCAAPRSRLDTGSRAWLGTLASALIFGSMAGCLQGQDHCEDSWVQFTVEIPDDWGRPLAGNLLRVQRSEDEPCEPFSARLDPANPNVVEGRVARGDYAELRLTFDDRVVRIGSNLSLEGDERLRVVVDSGLRFEREAGSVAIDRYEEHADTALLTPFRFGRTGPLPAFEDQSFLVNSSWNRGLRIAMKALAGPSTPNGPSSPLELQLRILDPRGRAALDLRTATGEPGNETTMPSLEAGAWRLNIETVGEPASGSLPRYAIGIVLEY